MGVRNKREGQKMKWTKTWGCEKVNGEEKKKNVYRRREGKEGEEW